MMSTFIQQLICDLVIDKGCRHMWMLPYGLADGHALLLEEVAEVLQLVAHVAHRRAGQVPLPLLGGPG